MMGIYLNGELESTSFSQGGSIVYDLEDASNSFSMLGYEAYFKAPHGHYALNKTPSPWRIR